MKTQESKVNTALAIRYVLNMKAEELKAYIAEAASLAPQHRTEMERLVIRVTSFALEGSR